VRRRPPPAPRWRIQPGPDGWTILDDGTPVAIADTKTVAETIVRQLAEGDPTR
jgi:hypothetical protein